MHKKFHKYNAIVRSLTLASLVSVVLATKSCTKEKKPEKQPILLAKKELPREANFHPLKTKKAT
ncbi:hypothetical protein KAH94_02465 [bacterium]|nr:hypothetical protein [bacterium]